MSGGAWRRWRSLSACFPLFLLLGALVAGTASPAVAAVGSWSSTTFSTNGSTFTITPVWKTAGVSTTEWSRTGGVLAATTVEMWCQGQRVDQPIPQGADRGIFSNGNCADGVEIGLWEPGTTVRLSRWLGDFTTSPDGWRQAVLFAGASRITLGEPAVVGGLGTVKWARSGSTEALTFSMWCQGVRGVRTIPAGATAGSWTHDGCSGTQVIGIWNEATTVRYSVHNGAYAASPQDPPSSGAPTPTPTATPTETVATPAPTTSPSATSASPSSSSSSASPVVSSSAGGSSSPVYCSPVPASSSTATAAPAASSSASPAGSSSSTTASSGAESGCVVLAYAADDEFHRVIVFGAGLVVYGIGFLLTHSMRRPKLRW